MPPRVAAVGVVEQAAGLAVDRCAASRKPLLDHVSGCCLVVRPDSCHRP